MVAAGGGQRLAARACFGSELTLGHDLGADYSGQTVYFIKESVSGTSLHAEWKPGTSGTYLENGGCGAEWGQMVRDTSAALQALVNAGHTPEIDGFFWHQGESDHRP